MLIIYGIIATIYCAVGGHLMQTLTQQNTPNKPFCLGALSIALLLHAYLLLPAIITDHGLSFGLWNTLGLISIFLLLYFIAFNLRHSILSLGLLAIPTALFGLGLTYVGRFEKVPTIWADFGLSVHIFLSLAAYCMLFMAAIQALIVRLQIRELKHQTHQRFWVDKLPPLQSMDGLLFEMILLGFALLSAALVFGAMATFDILGQHIAHKTFFSVLSWLIFGVLVIGHYRYNWHGKKMASLTLLGFVLLAIGFIGSKFVFEMILN